MSTTTTTTEKRFTEQFDGSHDYPDDMDSGEITQSPEHFVVSNDDTVLYCRETLDQWGICEFEDYSPNEGWTVGYVEFDDETHTVYVFETGSSWAAAEQLLLKADKLEAVADVLNRTSADIANSVETYRTYPGKINTDDGGTILIAPVVNSHKKDIQYDDEKL